MRKYICGIERRNYILVVYGKGRVNARKVCMVCEIVQVNMSCQQCATNAPKGFIPQSAVLHKR
jgi:hypothetical protein